MTDKVFKLINEIPYANDIKRAIFKQIQQQIKQLGFRIVTGEWLTTYDARALN